MEKIKPFLLKLALLLLTDGLLIVIGMVISNILHVTASGIFENEKNLPVIASVISLVCFAFLIFLLKGLIKVQKKQRAEQKPLTFALKEIVLYALFLLPLLFISLRSGSVEIFEGFPGYFYLPYLAFDLWNKVPYLAYPLYLFLILGANYLYALYFNKKDAKKPVVQETQPEEQPSQEND